MSNTKLTKDQKIELKAMKAQFLENDGQIFYNDISGFTCAFMPEFPGSKMARISVSFASENEVKFRAKVGVYSALDKMIYYGQFVIVPVLPENFQQWAACFEDDFYSF